MKRNNTKIQVLVLSVIASQDVEAHRAIDQDGSYTALGGSSFGVSDTRAYAGDQLALDVLGTSILEAGAAITKGDLLQVGANGKYVTKTTGQTVARAMADAAADGSVFEALLLPARA